METYEMPRRPYLSAGSYVFIIMFDGPPIIRAAWGSNQ